MPPSKKNYVHFSDKMTESLMNINRVIQDNRSTLDSIQDVSIELTRAIQSLEAAAIKYINMADKTLDTIVPILKKLPFVGKDVLDFTTEAQEFANKIVAACEMVEKVLPGVESGLTNADMAKLQSSTGDVKRLTDSLQALIPATAKK